MSGAETAGTAEESAEEVATPVATEPVPVAPEGGAAVEGEASPEGDEPATDAGDGSSG